MSYVDQSKRSFLKGRFSANRTAIRPPWAVQNFYDLCTRCDKCIDECQGNILVKGDGGFPEVNFSIGGCDWCEACVAACESQALDIKQSPAWNLKASITDQCLSMQGVICRSCSDACNQRAIYFEIQGGGRARPRINSFLCDGCGFCYGVCPENIIQVKTSREAI